MSLGCCKFMSLWQYNSGLRLETVYNLFSKVTQNQRPDKPGQPNRKVKGYSPV
jgi:hypothetical protein